MKVPAAILLSLLAVPAAAAQEQIRLEAASDQGTFTVEMLWTPADIGSDNTFAIRFLDRETGREVEDVRYDLLVFKEGGQSPDVHRVGQTAAVQHLTFEEPGQYLVRIDDIDGLGEGAQLPIRVTPEFPAAAPVAALAAGAVIAAGRLYRRAG